MLGDFLPTKLGMDPGESFVWACLTSDYSGHLLFFFENGKVARVELSAYQTQTKRRKLTGAYSDKSPLVAGLLIKEDLEVAVTSTEGRCLVFHTAALTPKTTRSTQGVNVMTLKPKWKVDGPCLWRAPCSRRRTGGRNRSACCDSGREMRNTR